jgi:hypothetical protein
MVELTFSYPNEKRPLHKRDKMEFEKVTKEMFENFFDDRKVQDTLKEPPSLELVISRDKEITPMLPNGEVYTRTCDEIIAEFKKLIEELKNI